MAMVQCSEELHVPFRLCWTTYLLKLKYCDDLATSDQKSVENEFFDADGSLKKDAQGLPLLKDASQLWRMAKQYPVDQLPSVTKAFALGNRASLLFAGASRIGNITVKNLVGTYLDSFKEGKTIPEIADDLKTFIINVYDREIPKLESRPGMEVILSGYSSASRVPQVFRLTFAFDWNLSKFEASVTEEVQAGKFKVVFGGQYDVIQRVVTGIDLPTFLNLQTRGWEMLRSYKAEVEKILKAAGHAATIPDIDEINSNYNIFGGRLIGVSRMHFDEGSLSEQAGIDFVAFLINTMIKAQEFSSSIPTVGGDIHIGMLSANHGLKWVTPEHYRFQDHKTPKS